MDVLEPVFCSVAITFQQNLAVDWLFDESVNSNSGVTVLHGSIEHGSHLADFVRAFPMPSPKRTYDKIRSYFLTMAKNSMKALADSNGIMLDSRSNRVNPI